MARRILIVLLVAAAAFAGLLAALPPSAVPLPAPAALESPTVPGAFHVHTNRSDGSGSMDEIARAARAAGLQFVIFTDHGDGTRAPEPPAYRDGVLTIDGVEISTAGGHYAAIGMAQAPYPLAGEPRDVVADVARLGGFGVVAHGDSPRGELQWNDWEAPVAGMEWINLDTEWRRASTTRLVAAFASYWFRGPEAVGSILGSPADALQRFDRLARTRRIVSIGTADAHGPMVPSYGSCFRAISTHVELDAPLSGDPAADAAALIDALAAGRHYTAIDAFASPATFEFTATPEDAGGPPLRQGEIAAATPRVLFTAHAVGPAGAEIVLLRDGEVVRQTRAQSMIYQTDGRTAAYRAEVRLPGRAAPWIVSNPIYLGTRVTETPPARPAPTSAAAVTDAVGWRADHDRASSARLVDLPSAAGGGFGFAFALGPGEARNQFASIAVPTPAALGQFDRVTFGARATRPMRLVVQLVRDQGGRWSRWQRSVYLDATGRTVTVFFDDLRPALGTAGSVPLDAVDALVLLVDTNNTAPGTSGEIVFGRIEYQG